MKLRAIFEYDAETQSYAVYCPELPGCASEANQQL
jgi:predicted RNase H-like HicB family nuclease